MVSGSMDSQVQVPISLGGVLSSGALSLECGSRSSTHSRVAIVLSRSPVKSLAIDIWVHCPFGHFGTDREHLNLSGQSMHRSVECFDFAADVDAQCLHIVKTFHPKIEERLNDHDLRYNQQGGKSDDAVLDKFWDY